MPNGRMIVTAMPNIETEVYPNRAKPAYHFFANKHL